ACPQVVIANGATTDAAITGNAATAMRAPPYRSTSTPLICMPISAPMPRISSSVPNSDVETPVRCRTDGKCTAQVASTTPKHANCANTATRAARRLRYWYNTARLRLGQEACIEQLGRARHEATLIGDEIEDGIAD